MNKGRGEFRPSKGLKKAKWIQLQPPLAQDQHSARLIQL